MLLLEEQAMVPKPLDSMGPGFPKPETLTFNRKSDFGILRLKARSRWGLRVWESGFDKFAVGIQGQY